MPFTVSHIAAALPGYRVLSRWHLFTPAVIGTMAPDFHILLPIATGRLQTHSYWPGLLTFSLPMGLACYALTFLLLKPAILEVAPDGPYERLREADHSPAPPAPLRWVLAVLAILVGAVTHLIWDGFTHEGAAGVRMFPILDGVGPAIDGHPLQLYRWLQYGSSVLGLGVLLIALGVWLRHATPPATRPARRLSAFERGVWLSFYILMPLAAMSLRFWNVHSLPQPLGAKLTFVAETGMRASALTLVLLSLIILVRLASKRRLAHGGS